MKKIIFVLLLIVIVLKDITAQTTPTIQIITKSKITFDNIVQDFGIIPYMGNGSHVFVITNTGTEPLIIINCIKSCGCTSVDWTKDPILPGNKGMVKATYNTKIKGPFNRGVVVYSNDPNNLKINLRLKGTVEIDPTIQNNPPANAVKAQAEKW